MNQEKPPWDPIRAAFFLVAGVIAFQCLIVLLGILTCIWWSEQLLAVIRDGKAIGCPAREQMIELLAQALAAALAFAGGWARKDKEDK